MRYILTKTVTHKICDDIIDNTDDVKHLIELTHEHELDCSIQLVNCPMYHMVRITDLREDNFTFQVIGPRANLVKTSRYSDIEYLKLNTQSMELIRKNPGVSRWMLLDMSDETTEVSPDDV